jgi:hypothetical protein
MITHYFANKILPLLCGKTSSLTSASSIYVGLSTSAPLADGTNVTEPVGNGYARVLLGNTSQELTQKMGTVANGHVENDEIIYFPEATGSWGTITHFCIFDSASSGNLLAFGALSTSIQPVANTIPIVRIGELDLSLS